MIRAAESENARGDPSEAASASAELVVGRCSMLKAKAYSESRGASTMADDKVVDEEAWLSAGAA
jgi:hypothetical protein